MVANTEPLTASDPTYTTEIGEGANYSWSVQFLYIYVNLCAEFPSMLVKHAHL